MSCSQLAVLSFFLALLDLFVPRKDKWSPFVYKTLVFSLIGSRDPTVSAFLYKGFIQVCLCIHVQGLPRPIEVSRPVLPVLLAQTQSQAAVAAAAAAEQRAEQRAESREQSRDGEGEKEKEEDKEEKRSCW